MSEREQITLLTIADMLHWQQAQLDGLIKIVTDLFNLLDVQAQAEMAQADPPKIMPLGAKTLYRTPYHGRGWLVRVMDDHGGTLDIAFEDMQHGWWSVDIIDGDPVLQARRPPLSVTQIGADNGH